MTISDVPEPYQQRVEWICYCTIKIYLGADKVSCELRVVCVRSHEE